MILLSNRPPRVGCPLVFIASLVPLLAASPAQAIEPHGVAWRTDLGTAQAESRARNLPLWIQFTGPWCVNCRRMERGAFVNPAVVASSHEMFVPVKLRSDEFEPLAIRLGLTVLPSTVIVKPTGEVIDKWEGYGDPGEFHVWLGATLARDGRLPERPLDKRPEIALASFCPVSLVDRRQLVPGLTTLTAIHNGAEYRFPDEASRTTFLTHPERYAPANRGECPVEHVDRGVFRPGRPESGVIYRGHLFLCANAADRDRFIENPERYANVDLVARDSCPHCWGIRPGRQLAQGPDKLPAVPSSATRRTISPPPSAIMEAFLAPVTRLRR